MKIVLLVIASLAFLTGCTTTTYQEGNAKFTRTSVLTKQSVGKVTARIDPKTGERVFELSSYATEGQAELVTAAVTAAVRAAK